MTKKISLVVLPAIILVILLGWLFMESSKPLPGEKIKDEGRGHVEIGTQVDYNSNPPTSGKHYADWVRSGFYSEPKDDRNLVHSLEHGYVIMSYNCDKKVTLERHPELDSGSLKWIPAFAGMTLVTNVYAHGIEEVATESAQTQSTSSALPTAFSSEDCHKLVDQLISIYEKKGKTRLIVVPRPNLDSRIALTAWGYLDKFDTFDQSRVEEFIGAHLNQGPEKTME